MEEIKKIITPLVMTAFLILSTGVYVFVTDTEGQGWGFVIGFLIAVYSVPVFMMNLMMSVLIKNRKMNLIFQLPISIIVLTIYWYWDLIVF